MSKRYTQDEVIKRFCEIHGTKYDYSKVSYTKMLEKVCIVCPDHGEFWMRPNDHLFNHGCPSCGGIHSNAKRIEREKAQIMDNGKTAFENRYEKIHEKRRQKNNYKSAARKRLQTMKLNGTYDTYRENWYRSMIKAGRFHDPKFLDGYEEFKRRVYIETRKTLRCWGDVIGYYPEMYQQENKVIDHKYSIKEGFINQIPIFVLSHICNLRIIDFRKNAVKGSSCSLYMEELLEYIHDFDQLNTRG